MSKCAVHDIITAMNEIIFQIDEDPTGGYTAQRWGRAFSPKQIEKKN